MDDLQQRTKETSKERKGEITERSKRATQEQKSRKRENQNITTEK